MKKFVYPQFKSAIKKTLKDYERYLKLAKKNDYEQVYISSWDVKNVLKKVSGCHICGKAESLYSKLKPEVETFCAICPWHTSGMREISDLQAEKAHGCYDIFLCEGYDEEHITKRIKRLEKWLEMIEKYKK